MASSNTDSELGVKPLDVDGVKTFKIGTAGFIIALVVCVVFRQQLTNQGQQWWLWTCVVGAAIGILGTIHTTRRSRVYAEDRQRRQSMDANLNPTESTTATPAAGE